MIPKLGALCILFMTVLSHNSFAAESSILKSARELPILQSLTKEGRPLCLTILDSQLELDLQSPASLSPETVQTLTAVFDKFAFALSNGYVAHDTAKFYGNLVTAISSTRLIDENAKVEQILKNLKSQERVSGNDWTPERIHHMGQSIVVLTAARDLLRVVDDPNLRFKIIYGAMKFAEPRSSWNDVEKLWTLKDPETVEYLKEIPPYVNWKESLYAAFLRGGPINGRIELLTQEIARVQNQLRESLKKRVIVRQELEGLVTNALGSTPATVLFLPKDQFTAANSFFALMEALHRPHYGHVPIPHEPLAFLKNEAARLEPLVKSQDRAGLLSELTNFAKTLRTWNGAGTPRSVDRTDMQNVSKVADFTVTAASEIRRVDSVPWQALMMLYDRDFH
jgi:hypothetical protein